MGKMVVWRDVSSVAGYIRSCPTKPLHCEVCSRNMLLLACVNTQNDMSMRCGWDLDEKGLSTTSTSNFPRDSGHEPNTTPSPTEITWSHVASGIISPVRSEAPCIVRQWRSRASSEEEQKKLSRQATPTKTRNMIFCMHEKAIYNEEHDGS